MSNQEEQGKGKTVIFVDADNLYGTKLNIGQKDLDDGELLRILVGSNKNIQIFYYFVSREPENKENSKEPFIGYPDFVMNYLQWKLAVSGISVNMFPAVKMSTDSKIIEDIFELLFLRRDKKYSFAEIIVISGDRAYEKALRRAKEEGIKIKIISGKQTCSRKLMALVDKVVFLEDIIQEQLKDSQQSPLFIFRKI